YDRVAGPDGKTEFKRKVVASADSWLHLEDFCNTFPKLYFTTAKRLEGLATDMRSAPTIADVDDVDIGEGRPRSNAESGARIDVKEVDPGQGRARGNAISGPPR